MINWIRDIVNAHAKLVWGVLFTYCDGERGYLAVGLIQKGCSMFTCTPPTHAHTYNDLNHCHSTKLWIISSPHRADTRSVPAGALWHTCAPACRSCICTKTIRGWHRSSFYSPFVYIHPSHLFLTPPSLPLLSLLSALCWRRAASWQQQAWLTDSHIIELQVLGSVWCESLYTLCFAEQLARNTTAQKGDKVCFWWQVAESAKFATWG